MLLFIIQEIKRDMKAFKEFVRMQESQLEYLVEGLTLMILKEDTNMRERLKPYEMVCLT